MITGGLARERDVTYGFTTMQYTIEMRISFLDPYEGKRLVFYSSADPSKPICPSLDGTPGKCIDRFLGAVAVVRYVVRLGNGGVPERAAIREYVTVTAQSPGLAERAPFSMTLLLVDGTGSDLQVFGYDEGPLKQVDRARSRMQRKPTWWRLYRQELYLDQETAPFAIVEWKHTLNRISIVEIYSPPDRERKGISPKIENLPRDPTRFRGSSIGFASPISWNAVSWELRPAPLP
jgi:hypothetical protein